MEYQIGFDTFARKATAKYAPVLEMGKNLFAMAAEMLQPPASQLLASLLRSACQTVLNSYQSVLLLTMNGCGSDALKIARSMFETSVSIGYLQKNPALLSDFIDYRWVKRMKHQEYLAQYAPDMFKAIDPAEIARTVAEYAKVKSRFKGRSSWSDKNLREMAKDIGIEQSYLGVYPFTSSIHHLDVIGIMAQEDDRILDVEALPSEANLDLALSISGMSAYIALTFFDDAVSLGKENALKAWFSQYGNVLRQVAEPSSSV